MTHNTSKRTADTSSADFQIGSGQRGILILVAVGLLLMFGVVLKERIENPHLVVQVASREGGNSMGGNASAMPSEVGTLMQQLAEKPDDVPALIQLGEHLAQGQQWTAAETFARRAIVAAPQEAQAHYLLGVILHGQNKSEEAVAALEESVRLEEDASARYSLGVLYIYYLENTPKGIEHLTAGLQDTTAPKELLEAMALELKKASLAEEETTQESVPHTDKTSESKTTGETGETENTDSVSAGNIQ